MFWLFALLTVFGVAALVGGGIMLMRDKPVSKIEEPINARRNVERSRRKAGNTRLFSRLNPDPFRYRKGVFKAATEAAFQGYLGIPRSEPLRPPGARTSVMARRRMNVRFGALSRRPAKPRKYPDTVGSPESNCTGSWNSKLKDALARQR